MTSADIVPQLKGVQDARRLNAVKALSVFQDVVEAKINGQVVLIRGQIDPNQKSFAFCSGHLSLQRFRDGDQPVIRKIAAKGDADASLLVYSTNSQGVLDSTICKANESKFTINVRDDVTYQQYSVSPANIIDVVFAEVKE